MFAKTGSDNYFKVYIRPFLTQNLDVSFMEIFIFTKLMVFIMLFIAGAFKSVTVSKLKLFFF